MNLDRAALSNLVQVFWVALLASGVSAYPVYQWLLKVKSRQIVSAHVQEHQKKMGTPTMGGITTVVGVTAALGFALVRGLYPQRELLACLALFLGFALIGFVDDFVVPRVMVGTRGLGWKQKLLMQIVLAGGAYWLSGSGDVSPLALGVSVFVVLFFSNAYNFSDGMDGLAGGILVALGGGLAALALLAGRSGAPLFAPTVLVAGILPFLYLNAPPAKIFMGDVGALPIGALLGFGVDQMLRSQPGDTYPLFVPLAVISLVMVVELVPVPLQVGAVKLLKRRIFPFTPIHHAFEKAGWAETRVVWMFILGQALCSALALALAVVLMK